MGDRRTGLVIGLIAIGALLPAPAAHAALAAPQVFLKELDASDMPTGNWIPLAGTPQMRSVNGYEIGAELQDTGAQPNRQRFLVQVTSVPDGHPDQKNIYSLCIAMTGTPGQIVQPDEQVRYEGDGTYTLGVTVSTGEGEVDGCSNGPTTTGSFTASAPTSLRFDGHLMLLDPSAHHKFGGLVITPAFAAGETEVVCARDPRRTADGSLTGSLVIDRDLVGSQENPSRTDAAELFKQVGRWACVGRGKSSGATAGPWSAPTATEVVQTGFYRPADGNTRLLDARGPVYRMSERFDPLTAGGRLTIVLRRAGKPKQFVRIRTPIGRGGVAKFSFRLPHLSPTDDFAEYVETLVFSGTRFVAARPAFGDLAIEATRTRGRRVDLNFSAPCAPRRC